MDLIWKFLLFHFTFSLFLILFNVSSIKFFPMNPILSGALCWVCEIVKYFLIFFFLLTSSAAFFYSGPFFDVFSFSFFLHVTLFFEKMGFSGYCNNYNYNYNIHVDIKILLWALFQVTSISIIAAKCIQLILFWYLCMLPYSSM